MFRIGRLGGVPCVHVLTDVDLANAPDFGKALDLHVSEPAVVVDLQRCRYFDSSGMSVIFARVRRQPFVVIVPADSVLASVIEVCGLQHAAVIARSTAEAEAAASAIRAASLRSA